MGCSKLMEAPGHTMSLREETPRLCGGYRYRVNPYLV